MNMSLCTVPGQFSLGKTSLQLAVKCPFLQQESIPVGCVSPTSVATTTCQYQPPGYIYPKIPTPSMPIPRYLPPWVYLTPWIYTPSLGIPNPLDTYHLSHGYTQPALDTYPLPTHGYTYLPWVILPPIYLPPWFAYPPPDTYSLGIPNPWIPTPSPGYTYPLDTYPLSPGYTYPLGLPTTWIYLTPPGYLPTPLGIPTLSWYTYRPIPTPWYTYPPGCLTPKCT